MEKIGNIDVDELMKNISDGAMSDDEYEKCLEEKNKPQPVRLPELPDRHKPFKRGDSTSKGWDAVFAKLEAKIMGGVTVGIVGQRGCGKTQLGVALIKNVCFAGRYCLYRKAIEIFIRLRSAMKSEYDSERSIIDELVSPFLLVIDAFEVRGETDFENRIIDHIIDRRYDAMKSTIIISNDTKEKLMQVLGESVCDRMRESGGIVEMNWSSFRAQPVKQQSTTK